MPVDLLKISKDDFVQLMWFILKCLTAELTSVKGLSPKT